MRALGAAAAPKLCPPCRALSYCELLKRVTNASDAVAIETARSLGSVWGVGSMLEDHRELHRRELQRLGRRVVDVCLGDLAPTSYRAPEAWARLSSQLGIAPGVARTQGRVEAQRYKQHRTTTTALGSRSSLQRLPSAVVVVRCCL